MEKLESHLVIGNEMGETPIWVEEEQVLFWVDAAKGLIYKQPLGDEGCKEFKPEFEARALTRRGDNGWVIATNNNGAAFWDEKTNECEFVFDPYENNPDMAFNDATVDRQGRYLVNSYNKTDLNAPDGSIYRLDPDRSVHKIATGLVLANGMGFSPDGKTLYVVEMFRYTVAAYDYDTEKGEASNKRVFVQIPEEKGMPDGLTVDTDGHVWLAHWGGWQISRFDPKGNIAREIKIPAEIVTCIGFGGQNMDELFITSATTSLTEEQLKTQPQAGDLFKIQLDVKGIPEEKFAG
jgi:sugar lactone lactonase YvrE